MNDSELNDSKAPDAAPVVCIQADPLHCPATLTLPAQTDTDGRVWPAAGITRLQNVPLKTLLDAGVAIAWRLPNGEVIDQEAGTLLVAARQADMDQGYRPVFEQAGEAPIGRAIAGPEAKL